MSPIVRRGDGRLEEPADGAVAGFRWVLSRGSSTRRSPGRGRESAWCCSATASATPGTLSSGPIRRLDPPAVAGMAKTDPVTVGEGILQDVWRHSAGQPQCDDMVMVVFGRVAAEHGVQPVPAPTGTKELLVAT